MTNLINWLLVRIADVRENEEGQALVEYGLVLALIAIVAIAALTAMGTSIDALLNTIVTAL